MSDPAPAAAVRLRDLDPPVHRLFLDLRQHLTDAQDGLVASA